MRREHHRHLHAGATTNSSSLAAAAASARSSPSACSSAQQAAAAWAWFEHGGSSCITPSKAEGLVTAKGCAKLYNSVGAGRPSRFKKEVLSSARKIPQQAAGSADDHHVLIMKPGRAASRRRHSYDHHHDLADRTSDLYDQRFSSSFRSRSPCFHNVNDQDVAENKEGSNANSACQNEVCSLLDKFEVEAVCKQLHDRFSPSRRSPCSSAEPHEYPQLQKTHHHHPQEHPKSRPYIKSCSASTHKTSAGNDHRHSINSVVRRLLHLHMKVSSGHSTSPSPAPAPPFFCSSIATANSIVDHHHHRRSPKHSKAETPINHMAKRPQGAVHNWGIGENLGKKPNYSGELRLNQVNSSIAEKVLAEHGDESLREDRVLALTRSNRHGQLHGDRVHHIHHHHHHYYHHMQQTNSEGSAQGAWRLLRDYYPEKHAGAHELQAPKIYRLHKESKLAISGAADHQEVHLQHQYECAAALGGGPQALAKFKAEKYLWPAARRAAGRTDHVDFQAPGAPLPTF